MEILSFTVDAALLPVYVIQYIFEYNLYTNTLLAVLAGYAANKWLWQPLRLKIDAWAGYEK